MNDEAILEWIRHPASREAGYRQLVIKYQVKLYHVIRRQVEDHADADDVLQNTFIKVFRNINSFEGRASLFTWLYRIACNETSSYLKQKKRHPVSTLEPLQNATADAFVDTGEINNALSGIVARLPDRQQEVFRMRYFEQLSYKEIAAILQLTEGALKASFHHAVRKIEEEFRSKQIL